MTAALDAMVEDRPPWQELALCPEVDPELFFPEKGGGTREAKKVCAGCEVREQCLQYALDNDERFGVWGGLSERERRRLRKGQSTPVSGRRWADPERDARILELIREGLTAPAIAVRLGLTGPHVVYAAAQRHGVSLPRRGRIPSARPVPRDQRPTAPAVAAAEPPAAPPATPAPPKPPAPAEEPAAPPTELRRARPAATRSTWTDGELAAAVAALAAARFTPAEIAAQLGAPVAAVRRHHRRSA